MFTFNILLRRHLLAKRRLRFGLRTLFLLVFLCAILSWRLAIWSQAIHDEEQAQVWLSSHHFNAETSTDGPVTLGIDYIPVKTGTFPDPQASSKWYVSWTQPPPWFVNVVARPSFAWTVNLDGSPWFDEAFAKLSPSEVDEFVFHVSRMPEIKTMDIPFKLLLNKRFRDALPRYKRLFSLSIIGEPDGNPGTAQLDDAELQEWLPQCPALCLIHLQGVTISSTATSHLCAAKQLSQSSLSGVQISREDYSKLVERGLFDVPVRDAIDSGFIRLPLNQKH